MSMWQLGCVLVVCFCVSKLCRSEDVLKDEVLRLDTIYKEIDVDKNRKLTRQEVRTLGEERLAADPTRGKNTWRRRFVFKIIITFT